MAFLIGHSNLPVMTLATTLQASELKWDWVPVDELDTFVIPRLARRLREAHTAAMSGGTVYLEHGAPVLNGA